VPAKARIAARLTLNLVGAMAPGGQIVLRPRNPSSARRKVEPGGAER
jgi:hypothetical protein